MLVCEKILYCFIASWFICGFANSTVKNKTRDLNNTCKKATEVKQFSEQFKKAKECLKRSKETFVSCDDGAKDFPCAIKTKSSTEILWILQCNKNEKLQGTKLMTVLGNMSTNYSNACWCEYARKNEISKFKLSDTMCKNVAESVCELIRGQEIMSSEFQKFRKLQRLNKSRRKALHQFNEEIIKHVRPPSFSNSWRLENGTSKLEIFVGNFTHFIQNKTTPYKSLRKLCQSRANCSVKRIFMRLDNVTVNTSHLWDRSPIAQSEIITLDYIVNGKLLSTLEETISLNFSNRLKRVLKEQVKCLFLDGEEWSDKNMSVDSVNEDDITCLTNHLSSFTMVILPKTDEMSASNKKAIEIIYYIGTGLSLAGLLISCIIYAVLFKDLKILTTSRHLVHFNLQIALGLTQIVFLVGMVATDDKVACKVVAILVHYFSLASFVWMLLEAVMLYLKLISVYSGECVRIKNFMVFGWGFPLLFVGLVAGIKNDKYGTKQWCWMSHEEDLFWVVFAPIMLVVSVTLVVVIAVARVVFLLSKSTCTDNMKRIISAARGVMILFPTLGLSWAFCVIALYSDFIVWQYLFAIFSSLQGFLIFLVYGVCNRELRVAVGRKMGYNVNASSTTT
ncbi:adhesion G-protein coupled receptor D1-like isoform X2 [Dendronephthya gigantea]|uniref:adhesion G-protein coupled receptor D1-like isoform X2 n=1 Tax=Dendronephthya gigantea TaxID=151771 RepID=UPI00106956C2|nr:adhesion G-protein coupled receptor D1-like isoform X2 [Dendronephthya gigantea]